MPSRFPSEYPSQADDVGDTGVRRRELFFLSRTSLDGYVRDRRAMVDGSLLTLSGATHQYVLRDAVRILGPGMGGADVFGMTGRVMSLADVLAMGGTVSSNTLRVGTVEYEVQLGYLVQSVPTAA